MTQTGFNIFLIVMAVLALIVFGCLFFVDAGYGKFYNKKWGPTIGNRLGWVLMESPVFVAMLVLCLISERKDDVVRMLFFAFFQLHYFQRSFIFPLLLKGEGRMPLSIIMMGVTFNTLNALMQAGWIFYISPEQMYGLSWLVSPQFIIGTVIFFAGMYINIDSDRRIRNLRAPGDKAHYLPRGGIFDYVCSANYFGEFLEWCGFAILTWSWSGAVFALWTFANLAPRAAKIHKRYSIEFAGQADFTKLKRIIPFVY